MFLTDGGRRPPTPPPTVPLRLYEDDIRSSTGNYLYRSVDEGDRGIKSFVILAGRRQGVHGAVQGESQFIER